MKEKIQLFLKHDILKVFSLNLLSTLIKVITGFVSIKIISTLIGPAGIALLGQLGNFTTIMLTFSTGGVHLGITKFVAQYKGDKNKISSVLNTGSSITFISTFILSLVILLLSNTITIKLFGSSDYISIIVILSVTLIFYSLNSFVLSVLNGLKEFKRYVLINIWGNILGAIFTILLAYFYGIYGALLAAVTSQSIMFFLTIYLNRDNDWLNYNLLNINIDLAIIKKLLNYSIMAFVTAVTLPFTQMLVRGLITNHLSLDQAGIWEGMNRISAMYLMLITSSLSIYYLPRLAELKTNFEVRKEIFFVSKLVVPILIICSFGMFFFKDLIIKILFSSRFTEMSNLFGYQLIGDFFKICTWIVGYQLIAKSKVFLFVFNEILFSVILYFLSQYFIFKLGVVGASIAYAVAYFLNFIFILFIFRKTFKIQN